MWYRGHGASTDVKQLVHYPTVLRSRSWCFFSSIKRQKAKSKNRELLHSTTLKMFTWQELPESAYLLRVLFNDRVDLYNPGINCSTNDWDYGTLINLSWSKKRWSKVTIVTKVFLLELFLVNINIVAITMLHCNTIRVTYLHWCNIKSQYNQPESNLISLFSKVCGFKATVIPE